MAVVLGIASCSPQHSIEFPRHSLRLVDSDHDGLPDMRIHVVTHGGRSLYSHVTIREPTLGLWRTHESFYANGVPVIHVRSESGRLGSQTVIQYDNQGGIELIVFIEPDGLTVTASEATKLAFSKGLSGGRNTLDALFILGEMAPSLAGSLISSNTSEAAQMSREFENLRRQDIERARQADVTQENAATEWSPGSASSRNLWTLTLTDLELSALAECMNTCRTLKLDPTNSSVFVSSTQVLGSIELQLRRLLSSGKQ